MPKIKRESRSFIVINEEKLILEVQKRPILYDKALKGYRKPVTRENAWQEVSELLQSPGNYSKRTECLCQNFNSKIRNCLELHVKRVKL